MKRFLRLAVLLLTAWVGCILLALAGCTRVPTEQAAAPAPSPFSREPYDEVCILAVDKSGSMAEMMKPGGKGLEFANATIDKYFSQRLGSNDFLVVTQLSGNQQAVLWAGEPRQLHQEFASNAEWAEFIDKKSAVNGSRLWDGLSDSLELVMSDPTMWNPHTRVVLIAVSDLENNLIDNYTAEQRLDKDLKAFAKGGGVIGLYFVGTQETIRWRAKLPTMGFKDFVVSPNAETHPRWPSFE